jgi:hypothetical protein
MAAAAGCNFLDVVPDDTATLDDAFKNEQTAEAFLFTCYSYQYDYRNWRGLPGRLSTDELCMESRWGIEWFPIRKYNEGVVGSSSGLGTDLYDMRDTWLDLYQGIRQCHTFLDNIDDVTPVNTAPDVYARLKNQWKGEATFLLAYYHQLIFQIYGPAALIKTSNLEPHARSSAEECASTIAAWYDYAASVLPDNQGRANYGRADKMIALAQKAKMLLYAASPLYNGDPEGVFSDASDAFKQLVHIGTPDQAKWEAARIAAKAAIDFAKEQGKTIYIFNGVDPVTRQAVATDQRKAYLSCRNVLIDSYNSEIIWGYGGTSRIEGDQWARHVVPRGLGTRGANLGDPVGGLAPTLAAVKIFYTSNGKPPESDPQLGYDWSTERMTVPAGASTCNLHLGREQRFYAAIGYDGGVYEFNDWTEHTLNFKRGANSDDKFKQGLYVGNTGTTNDINTSIANQDRSETGYCHKKDINPRGVATSSAWTPYQYVFPLMRLADLYLMYAEACAHSTGSLDQTAKEYLKEIHNRAGLDGNNIYYANYQNDNLVEAIRRERMIELIFESHWHYDLRRWEIADKWHGGRMWGNQGFDEKDGMWGLNILGTTNAELYREVNTNGGLSIPYRFQKRMYLMPIYYEHINKNPLLVQNPGY